MEGAVYASQIYRRRDGASEFIYCLLMLVSCTWHSIHDPSNFFFFDKRHHSCAQCQRAKSQGLILGYEGK